MSTILIQTPPRDRPRKTFRYDDWCTLTNGHIELRLGESPVSHGRVELTMPDGSALWLHDDIIFERRYYAIRGLLSLDQPPRPPTKRTNGVP